MDVSRRALIGANAVAFGASMIGDAQADAAQAVSSVPGWNALIERFRTLPDRMLARLPERMRADPQIQQEVARFALESFASSAIEAIGADGDNPVFLGNMGQVLNVGAPNCDTVYRSAVITPGGSYRLRGERGSIRMARIGQYSPYRPNAPVRVDPYLDLNTLHVDSEGRFDVFVSPTRPAHHQGDWWELGPETNRFFLRFVSANWAREKSPTIAIERVDKPPGAPRRSAAELERRLGALANATDLIGLIFIDHVERLRDEGFVNRAKEIIVAQGGLAGQHYYEGVFDIAEDEALLVEVRPPAHCLYRSILLTNELYETIDWTNNQSGLNDAQADVDGDGMLRIVIAARDPGVKNWLDTAGHLRGLIQGRWAEADSAPIPSIRKMRITQLAHNMPRDTRRVTPAERERIVRERRAAAQQRPLW